MKSSFANIAGIAGMAVLVAGAALWFGAGPAQAKPKRVVPRPHPMSVTHFMRTFETQVDNFIDSTYPNGERSVFDPFSDLLTPLAK